MQEIVTRAREIFEGTDQKVLDHVAHTRRQFRERSIGIITQSLNPDEEADKIAFQNLPIEFLERGDPLGAIWFIETVGKKGNFIDWNIIKEVVGYTLKERERMINYDDELTVNALTMSLKSLFKMALAHPRYNEIPELHIYIGNMSEMEGKLFKAQSYYDKAMELGSVDGFIASAQAYKAKGLDHMNASILSDGYSRTGDIKLLKLLITAQCSLGKIGEALDNYHELMKMKGNRALPFLFYKGTVENDNELKQLEEMLAIYMTEGTFIPFDTLLLLSESAANYVNEGIKRENQIIMDFDKKDKVTFSDEEGDQYINSIQLRLFYMQFDVLTLGNHRYIDYYLRELKNFGLLGTPARRAILDDYFTRFFSEEVKHERELRMQDDPEEVKQEGEMNMQDDTDEEAETADSDGTTGGQDISLPQEKFHNLFENISLHVSRVGELYFNPSFYDIQSDVIAPMLRGSALLNHEYNEEMDDDLANSMYVLKNHSDYYYSLRPDVRESYEDFVMEFDKMYGTFYRRQIQGRVLDESFVLEGDVEATFKTHIEVGFFYWLESAISGRFPTSEPDEIETIVKEYNLGNTNISNALLFGTILYDISPDYAMLYLADYPNMLCVPQALYVITDGLRQLDTKTRNSAIRDLHALVKDEYNARGFFEHIRYTFGNLYKNNPTDEDVEYMLLTSGNMAILQRKETMQSIYNFKAATEYGSLEGLKQAGDSLVKLGDYENALYLFEQAFLQDQTITVVTKIIQCSIEAGKFDTAQSYIDFAFREGLIIPNYIAAFYLWQGNLEHSFRQIIPIIRDRSELIDVPEGFLFRLKNSIAFVLGSHQDTSDEQKILGIMATFLDQNIMFDGVKSDMSGILSHWEYIATLCKGKEKEEMYVLLESNLKQFTGEFYDDYSQEDRAMYFIHKHADTCYNSIILLFNQAQQDKDEENIVKLLGIINILSEGVAAFLSRFTNSKELIVLWRTRIVNVPDMEPMTSSFKHSMPMTIQ